MSVDQPRQGRSGRKLRKGALTIFAVPAAIAVPLVATDLSAQDGSARAATTPGVAQIGQFGQPFEEPTVGPGEGFPRVKTPDRCVERKNSPTSGPTQGGIGHGFIDCKPTAGTQSILPGGKVLYWDNLAGTENVDVSIASEYGVVGLNDQTRLMDPSRHQWLKDPFPIDGGGKNQGQQQPLFPGPNGLSSTENSNDASLFCADQNFLPDGRLIASGGTRYLNEPGVDQSKFGSTELEGIVNTRVYNPKTDLWTQMAPMHKGRWYETMVTMPTGNEFVASGLSRLIKPFNRDTPLTPQQVQQEIDQAGNGYSPGFGVEDGQNERTTEIYDYKANRWTLNPDSARKTLPLFPRLHMLPDGKVFYDPVGQSFNPAGQAYDEALWNIASVYDPHSQRWTDLGIPGTPATSAAADIPKLQPGFRGSTFSAMLPLKPGADGRYSKANFLVGGGVLNPPSPGGYFAIRNSDIRTVDTAHHDQLTVKPTGQMIASTTPVSGRWYGTGTVLPTGQVLATSGSDRDEVVLPGLEIAQRRAELFEPSTNTWRPVALQNRSRTYHNTANLLPDGTVLIGGHAIISNSYTKNFDVPGGVTGPNGAPGPGGQGVGRDPTFEVYKPPYMYCPGTQAKVTGATLTHTGSRDVNVRVDVPASQIQSVVLVRNGSLTHEVDGDQRTVELKVIKRSGNVVTVQGAPNANVIPPGPYMLFANRSVNGCVKPSKSLSVFAASAGRLKVNAPRRAAVRHRAPRRHVAPRFTG